MLFADAGEVAHRLTETEVVAFVLIDLAVIVAAARVLGGLFVRSASRAWSERSSPGFCSGRHCSAARWQAATRIPARGS